MLGKRGFKRESPTATRDLQDFGDELREKAERPELLAQLAIYLIAAKRARSETPPRTAWIVRSLRRPEEVTQFRNFGFGQARRRDDRGRPVLEPDPMTAQPRVLQESGTFSFGGPALPASRIAQVEQELVNQFEALINDIPNITLPTPSEQEKPIAQGILKYPGSAGLGRHPQSHPKPRLPFVAYPRKRSNLGSPTGSARWPSPVAR